MNRRAIWGKNDRHIASKIPCQTQRLQAASHHIHCQQLEHGKMRMRSA